MFGSLEKIFSITILYLISLDSTDLQSIVDIFPSVEELNGENNNKYFCDHCKSLQEAKKVIVTFTNTTLQTLRER